MVPMLGCSIAELDTRAGRARRRLEPAQGSADRRASRSQGGAQGRERRVREPRAVRVPLQAAPRTSTAALDAFAANLAAVLAARGERSGKRRAGAPARVPSRLRSRRMRIARRRKRWRASRRSCCSARSRSAIRSIPTCARSRPALAAMTGATLGYLTRRRQRGRRGAGGRRCRIAAPAERRRARRLQRAAMLETARKRYVLFGIEPAKDSAEGAGALDALRAADASSRSRRSSPTSCSTSPTCCCRSGRSPRRRART